MSVGAITSELWAVTKLVSPTIWALAVVAPALLGFSVARWLSGRARLMLLLIVIPLPVWLFTAPIVYFPPAQPSSFAWWATGMLMIAPVAVAWALVAAVGARVGWRNVR